MGVLYTYTVAIATHLCYVNQFNLGVIDILAWHTNHILKRRIVPVLDTKLRRYSFEFGDVYVMSQSENLNVLFMPWQQINLQISYY